MNRFEKFLTTPGVTPAITSHHTQSFFLGFADRLHDRSHPDRIHRHGFFTENVLTGIDGRRQMPRAKTRRGGQHHHVHATGKERLIAVEPSKPALSGNIDPVFKLIGKRIDGAIRLAGKNIRHRVQLAVAVSAQGIGRRPRAPAATANQSNLQLRSIRLPTQHRRKTQRHAA